MEENEELWVMETDQGDGWTRGRGAKQSPGRTGVGGGKRVWGWVARRVVRVEWLVRVVVGWVGVWFVVGGPLTARADTGQWSALGQWFDRLPDGTILDQRGLWVLLLVVLVVKGGGPVALDRVLLARRR